MNLGELIDYVGNLLDYDPTNETYRQQLVAMLNDAQTRCLTDRPWDFAIRDRKLKVWTDVQAVSIGVVNGSSTVTGGPFPISTSAVKPGSEYELGYLEITDSNGDVGTYRVMYVALSNQLFIDRDFEGATGSYTAKLYRREVYLPSDCVQIQNVGDPSVGIPAKALFLSKFEREDADLDPSLLGAIEAYLPSEGLRVPAPQTPRGVSIVGAVGQGVRTVHVYMVNVWAPFSTNFQVYPRDASDGFESAFSKVATFLLQDNETLTFTPESVASKTGFYRRYYFTCPDAGILAPVRVRGATVQGVPVPNVDTVPPPGGVTLTPDLSLATLSSQTFQATSLRYRWDQSAAYQSIQFYPHPAEDQQVDCRMLISPSRMLEDQDAPLVPAAYAQIIAYSALENVTLKVANPALSAVYTRKKDTLYKGMEQAYLKAVPRRMIKGEPAAGYRSGTNFFGPLSWRVGP